MVLDKYRYTLGEIVASAKMALTCATCKSCSATRA
jgi:hypothetical protein